MSANETVVVHKSEMLHGLLCGKQQMIGSSPTRHSASVIRVADHGVKHAPELDFPFPGGSNLGYNDVEPGAIPVDPLRRIVPKNHPSLKQTEETLEHVEGFLGIYEKNRSRKAMILHQDYGERYLQPLARKLVEKTTGPEYEEYCRKRVQALSAPQSAAQTGSDFSKTEPEFQTLTMNISDIVDPIVKYRKNAEKEQRLERFIKSSMGQNIQPPHLVERDTMDVKKWAILDQTRFYHGKSEVAVPKGKRVYGGKFQSRIDGMINEFVPGGSRASRARSSMTVVPPTFC